MTFESGKPMAVEEAAKALNMSKSTVRYWVAARRLGHIRLGRAIRIPDAEIRRLLEAGFVPAERSGR